MYILMYLMLYFVLVYECVLVQMLSARSGVLSFNRLSNHLFLTVHMRSFCFGSPGFLSPVPVVAAHLRSFFEKVGSLPRVFIVYICAHTFPR